MFANLNRVKPYLRRYRGYIIGGLFAVAAHNVLRLISPMVLKRAVDKLETGISLPAIWGYAALVVALAAGAGVFLFVMRRTIIWASRKMEFDLRGDLFQHLLTLSPSFFDRTPTGEILSRASTDVEAVRMMLGPGIMYMSNAILVGGGALPFMFYLDWELALYTLIPLPILSLAVNRLGAIVHRRFMEIQKQYAVISAHAQESLAGIRVVKSGSREQIRHQEFVGLNDTYFTLNMDLIKVQGLFRPLLFLLAGLSVVVVLYLGGQAVIAGRITLGTFVAFTVYLGMLVWPMIALGWVVSLYQRGTASLHRIDEIFQASSDVGNGTGTSLVEPIKGKISIRDLTFTYPNADRPVIRDLSLEVEPGETVALMGPTGCGKSTLLYLLNRSYPVPEGTIFLDGKDINTIPLGSLRQVCAVAAQEPFLFSNSLERNVNFGRESDLQREQMDELADAAGVLGEIEDLPRGWQTIIGERGITLSGGQKQRISLARALAVDARVLLLDDAFSSVDTNTEEHILNHLGEFFSGRTVLLVSHRVSTVRRADRIAVMESGRIIELGTHEELLARGEHYAQLAEKQQLQDELAAY